MQKRRYFCSNFIPCKSWRGKKDLKQPLISCVGDVLVSQQNLVTLYQPSVCKSPHPAPIGRETQHEGFVTHGE